MEQTDSTARRDSFLLAMYGQMWGNINRHILVIWQSVAALLGAFAIFALIEKKVIPFDLACAVVVLICAWVGAHIIDANFWFARNLLIIANIERQFLTANDSRLIHPHFAEEHKQRTLAHLTVQAWFSGGVFLLIACWHFSVRVAPGLSGPRGEFEFFRALPYIVALVAVGLLFVFLRTQGATYKKLLRNSPGASLTTDASASSK